MNSPKGRKILNLIANNPMTVTDIWITTRLKDQSTTSGWLGVLRRYMLVKWERQGKHIYYSADVEEIEHCNEAVLEFLES